MTPGRLLGCLVGAALCAGSAHAQTIISDYPPLSPEEAVRVLRGSHSIADLTDYRSPGKGPTVVVMGSSTTPWTWPDDAFVPPAPLSTDPGWYSPYNTYYGPGYNNTHYAPRNDRIHDRTHRTERAPAPPPPAPTPPPRHIVMPAAPSAGLAGHRR
jgi:hypothetical protein